MINFSNFEGKTEVRHEKLKMGPKMEITKIALTIFFKEVKFPFRFLFKCINCLLQESSD